MIENNIGKIICFFLVVFTIQIGIGVWRLPPEFRKEVIPKLERQIAQYDSLVDIVKDTNVLIRGYIILNEKRVNLLLDVAEQKSKVDSWM